MFINCNSLQSCCGGSFFYNNFPSHLHIFFFFHFLPFACTTLTTLRILCVCAVKTAAAVDIARRRIYFSLFLQLIRVFAALGIKYAKYKIGVCCSHRCQIVRFYIYRRSVRLFIKFASSINL